ncbi:FecCD family ABC transporter permease [Actinokineospora iranica]|uniref:Iron complex transport system permease protein n=1 Tax=Actinokineospora iranica TaxID=1271860 RepID=A0A1G6T7M5_9PSEU|nr:iron chelate uptake ABC transporter family permease subunit [Actinokineospora iranica]SDD25090.1 iron complex transport system permease protein [Actinokineospora iranica]
MAVLTYRIGARGPSGEIRPRVLAVCVALAVVAFAAFCVELTVGDYPIDVVDAARALFWYGDPTAVEIVYDLRLPRALVGLFAGLAFGMAGALFQTMARNPLASPEIIGVTEGANTAAVAGIVLGFGGTLSASSLALFGGLVSAVAVYLLAWRQGTTGYRIVLVGIGVAALFTSTTNYLLQRADLFQAQRAVVWLTGSLNLREWRHVAPVAVAVLVLVPLALLMSRWLSALTLGDDTARGLGVPVQKARLGLMLSGVGLVAFATAAAGPVAFVSLVAPQIALRLARRPTPPLLTSALTGAVIVLVGDLMARPFGLPVGIVTGAVGAPYLLWLLARANRVGA